MKIQSLTLLLLLCLATTAEAWWNAAWRQRVPITIDATQADAAAVAQENVPVLVRLHAGNFPGLLGGGHGGADLRFVTAADERPLDHHVELFDPATQLALVWVKAPRLGPAERIDLYFDNAEAPAGADSGRGYDVNTVASFHFGESSGLPIDATAYRTPVVSGDVTPNAGSLIGRGVTLSGSAPLMLGDAPQLRDDGAAGWTFMTWLRIAATPEAPTYLLDRSSGEARLSLTVGANGLSARLNEVETNGSAPLTPGQWHHVGLTVGDGMLRVFLDGRLAAETAVSATAFSGPVAIGGASSGENPLAADLDELTIANTARAAAWINLAYLTQGPRHDTIVSYGVAETDAEQPAQAGHFAIIFQNVFGKKDAWVEQIVIGICGVMMAIAILIMVLKATDLTRAGRASTAFLRAYAGLDVTQAAVAPQPAVAAAVQPRTAARVRFVGDATASAPAPPPRDGGGAGFDSLYQAGRTFGDSPLWRVYRVGLDEIRKRHAHGGIDDKAMASVRASLDAVMVRETQRLNSRLVLLTIAISGGPFIGLFGTVVGVMVTFAAIAATGDVNIAAIAPGMAAALLATVAGLGVAIPSLFGYNYLGSRAREIGADMHVFADELLARFNELYGR